VLTNNGNRSFGNEQYFVNDEMAKVGTTNAGLVIVVGLF
jgi:hypothetical protein